MIRLAIIGFVSGFLPCAAFVFATHKDVDVESAARRATWAREWTVARNPLLGSWLVKAWLKDGAPADVRPGTPHSPGARWRFAPDGTCTLGSQTLRWSYDPAARALTMRTAEGGDENPGKKITVRRDAGGITLTLEIPDPAAVLEVQLTPDKQPE